jgi:hypothetical protein
MHSLLLPLRRHWRPVHPGHFALAAALALLVTATARADAVLTSTATDVTVIEPAPGNTGSGSIFFNFANTGSNALNVTAINISTFFLKQGEGDDEVFNVTVGVTPTLPFFLVGGNTPAANFNARIDFQYRDLIRDHDVDFGKWQIQVAGTYNDVLGASGLLALGSGFVTVQDVPEPSPMILAGVAAACVAGCRAWTARRRGR